MQVTFKTHIFQLFSHGPSVNARVMIIKSLAQASALCYRYVRHWAKLGSYAINKPDYHIMRM